MRLVPLPKAKAVMVIMFATCWRRWRPRRSILKHGPSAVEVMDRFDPRPRAAERGAGADPQHLHRGRPGGHRCAWSSTRTAKEDLPPRLAGAGAGPARARLRLRATGTQTDPHEQARVWSLREASLGLSMAMKDDAKSISFVEDTAVAPEKLRDYIDALPASICERHGTTAGIYAHASVGCLHVRPVVNMKTEEGVRKFEAIAQEVADLVLEFGGALSGEHGDGLVRSPFIRQDVRRRSSTRRSARSSAPSIPRAF